ncbi:MAG TPA: hypothetical protein VF163_17435 [Micromonosporaceae bacterium]
MNTTTRPAWWRPFARHFLEMVAAMAVGMMVLGMLVRFALTMVGHASVLDRTEPAVLIMATNMTVAMVVFMRYRRHGWVSVTEMALAMYAPFLALLVPFWSGAISGSAVMIGGHLLMLPVMLLVMLRRRAEYAHGPTADQAPVSTTAAPALADEGQPR